MSKIKKTTLFIKGMHCPSCEILVNDKFKEAENIIKVIPDFKKQKATIFYQGQLDEDLLNKKIKPFGYQIEEENKEKEESLGKKLFETFTIAAIILILYLIAKELNLIPSFDFNGNLSLLTIFIIGLVASTSTCMATSGALFLATIGKKNSNLQFPKLKQIPNSKFQIQNSSLQPALIFSLGRILSYGFFGFLAGLVGQTLITNFKFGPFLTFLAAVFMILLGLDMMKILLIGSVVPSGLNKAIFENLEHKLLKYPRKAPFFLGGLTYILPCGFTQAVQVYALGQASPIQSALTMVVFAVGTTPALILVGALTSITKSEFYRYFMKVMGVLVFFVGFLYFSNFLSLYGININPLTADTFKAFNLAKVKNGVQEINMKVVSSGYEPNYFKVKKGIPVKWNIEGINVFSCQAYLVVPKLGIQKTIKEGWQTIEFTPNEAGSINFSCGMGMYRGRIEVVN